VQTPTLFARGLRNSLALVRHPSGALFQGENSIDIDDPDFPYDEINQLKPGGDYGWPYCVNAADRAPAWRGGSPLDCKSPAHTAPVLLLPPHGAPLAMLYYHGPMFPELEGRLLVTLHGYRATGSRIVAYAVDAAGAPVASKKARYGVYNRKGPRAIRRPFREGPAADGLILTPGWDARRGLRPDGAPVGFTVADDGALWVAEDRNGTILRFARDTAPPTR
jgi:glucose/arabinose dehydrogenase